MFAGQRNEVSRKGTENHYCSTNEIKGRKSFPGHVKPSQPYKKISQLFQKLKKILETHYVPTLSLISMFGSFGTK